MGVPAEVQQLNDAVLMKAFEYVTHPSLLNVIIRQPHTLQRAVHLCLKEEKESS